MAAGVVKATLAEFTPRVMLLTAGADGPVAATNTLDEADGALVPSPFVATTVQL